LDILVIDLPPGTGDIQLTLVQKLKIDGVIIVSTPQEIALIDARRAAEMFTKTGAPILGVVENMAYFTDPTTGAPIEIFGRGGAKATAQQVGAPFLGEVPIDIALRQACDAGRPITAIAPESPAGQVFMDMARQVKAKLGA
jgi:ATP-binding protein involved in chromosome partitioning